MRGVVFVGAFVSLASGTLSNAQTADSLRDDYAKWREVQSAPDPAQVIWAEASAAKDRFWVTKGNVSREYQGTAYGHVAAVWVEGDHRSNASVKHRKSEMRAYFDCAGRMRVSAWTHYSAEGLNMGTWDGYGQWRLIRPTEMFRSLERAACAEIGRPISSP